MITHTNKKRLPLLGFVLLAYAVFLIPVSIVSLQNKQNTQGRASTELAPSPTVAPSTVASDFPPLMLMSLPTVCSTNAPVDVEVILDKSGSMNDKTGTNQPTKIEAAKTAAVKFVDFMSQNIQSRLGLTTFANTGTLDISLTNNYNSVKTQITTITANGGTCIECSINKAQADIQAVGRAGIKKAVVLLTDGKANYIDGNSQQQSTTIAEQKALAAALASHNTSGTVFFTIGLGADVNANFLQQIATSTGGKYYFPPTTESLDAIYTEISQIIAKGAVSGTIFNDSNKNGVMDTTEPKLPNWTVQIVSTTNAQSNTTATSDSNGSYSIAGLSDGSYTLKAVIQAGWMQTLPANSGSYPISVASGNSITDKNFGVAVAARCSDLIDNDNNSFTDSKDSTCHTDGNPGNPASYDPNKDGEHGGNTCADSKDNNNNGLIDGADPVCHTDGNPGNPASYDPQRPEGYPSLDLTVFLDGIGSRGDNANPTQSTMSNKSPIHPTISADIQIFNSANALVGSGAGQVSYNQTSGSYKGTIPFASSITEGLYTVKIKVNKYLRRQTADIQTIKLKANNTISAVSLVAGDVNNDNRINILDYNLLVDCYSDLSVAVNCVAATKKDLTDLNDDNFVNQLDYNLFLREISTQPGN